jgi:probable HAF family extracellular repeat protein
MSRQFRLLPLLLALSAVSFGAQAAPTYSVMPVGGFGGSNSLPGGLNNAGTMVGYAYTPGSHINAYAYSNGATTSLHQGAPNSGNSRAAGINESGAVVGELGTANGPTRAAVFTNGGVQLLGTLGGTNSYGNGINASGQVVGRSDTADGAQHGFVTGPNGTLVDIGPLNGGGSSDANAINDLGAVTGYVEIDGDGDYRAYIYANGSMQILGTLGGNYAQGYAINNAGMVAGYSYLAGDAVVHAFLYTNGLMQDIGDFGGDTIATGINAAGSVVGMGMNSDGFSHAFLYSGGLFQDLNSLIDPSLGWNVDYAADINDKGQIAAHGCNANGECADLLLSLADTGGGDPDPNPLPEPEAFTAGIAGLALFGLLRRRRARR